VRDPQSGTPVVSNVYQGEQIYSGTQRERGPDLVIGYARGYRVSWNSALGQRGKQQFNNNQSHWTGDHLIDPVAVPGVVFSSRKLSQPAGLVDIAPTILDYFGLAPGQSMSGKCLWGK
jgi:predicted AlkP superfamily phosphohydrolase/phosphomutase